MRPAGRQSLRVSRAPERRACLASGTRRKRNRRDPRPTPYMHEHPAQAVRSHTTRQTTPSSTGQRRPTLPSFVYRQEVFELSIYVTSSIAHAHEESNRGLAISHKHTTWAKVDFHNAWRHSATDSFQMNDLALRAAILSAKPSEGAEMPENAATDATPTESQVVIPEILPMEGESTFARKAKGVAQVAAGSALTAAGIPMLVLPGPGVAAIVGGAALVSRGNRNYTGRTATPLEERLDEAASKAADLAANTAKRTAGKAGEKAKDTALKTGAIAREAAEMAATSAPEVAKGFARGATAAAHVASGAAKSVAREAKPLFASVKRATGAAISSAKRAEQGTTKRSR